MRLTWVTAVFVLLGLGAAHAQTPERVASRLLIEQMGGPLGIAEEASVPPMAPLAIDILKHFEGWVPNAYNDPVGYCTIGYGHLIALNRCEQIQLGSFAAGLSEADGALLLEGDTLGARAAVQELVIVALTDEQFGALSDFVYNVGRRNFERSTLLELLNMGEYALAAAELRRWVRARGRILPGLVTRRACEESLFDGRLTYDIYGRFDRAACVSLGIADDVGPLIDVELGEDAN